MKVAVIGSRESGHLSCQDMLQHIPLNTTELVSGGAEGVDALAQQAAEALSLPLKVFLPDYASYGKQAPLMRNKQIVAYADLVLAFWDGHSKGTAHVIDSCIASYTPFRIILI